MRHKMLIPLLLIVLAGAAISGVSIAEARSRAGLDRDLRSFIATAYPDAQIEDTNVRGRPYVISRMDHTVSTAYVEVSGPADGVRRRLLVQNLDLQTGTAQSVQTVVTVPYPAVHSDPVLDTTTDSSQVVLDGELVSYRAEIVEGRLVITTTEHGADPRFAPAPVDVQSVVGEAVQDGSVPALAMPTEAGVAVLYAAADVGTK